LYYGWEIQNLQYREIHEKYREIQGDTGRFKGNAGVSGMKDLE
jgi:hypothetical protein